MTSSWIFSQLRVLGAGQQCLEIGHVAWRPFLTLLSCYPLMCSTWGSEIYGCRPSNAWLEYEIGLAYSVHHSCLLPSMFKGSTVFWKIERTEHFIGACWAKLFSLTWLNTFNSQVLSIEKHYEYMVIEFGEISPLGIFLKPLYSRWDIIDSSQALVHLRFGYIGVYILFYHEMYIYHMKPTTYEYTFRYMFSPWDELLQCCSIRCLRRTYY